MVERYPGPSGRTEYGGGDGIQRYPDGTSVPLEDLASGRRVSDRARLMRTAGLADFDPDVPDEVGLVAAAIDVSGLSEAQKEAYAVDLARTERIRARQAALMDRTNGYIAEPDRYVGEGGEGNGVQPFE